MSEEVWKPVPSKPGVMVSSLGRVKLPEREAEMPYGGIRVYKTKPTFGTKTRSSKTARHVYLGISSRVLGNMKVHRLVCEAFHGPKPFEGAVVIHIDEDALNNRPENLKWGSMRENMNGENFLAYCKARTGENSPRAKWKRAREESHA